MSIIIKYVDLDGKHECLKAMYLPYLHLL